MKIKNLVMILTIAAVAVSCTGKPKQETTKEEVKVTNYSDLTKQYAKVKLTSDISHLSDNEKQMLNYLYEVGNIMDDIFCAQKCRLVEPNWRKPFHHANKIFGSKL